MSILLCSYYSVCVCNYMYASIVNWFCMYVLVKWCAYVCSHSIQSIQCQLTVGTTTDHWSAWALYICMQLTLCFIIILHVCYNSTIFTKIKIMLIHGFWLHYIVYIIPGAYELPRAILCCIIVVFLLLQFWPDTLWPCKCPATGQGDGRLPHCGHTQWWWVYYIFITYALSLKYLYEYSLLIRQSVDCLCRDGPDMQYM